MVTNNNNKVIIKWVRRPANLSYDSPHPWAYTLYIKVGHTVLYEDYIWIYKDIYDFWRVECVIINYFFDFLEDFLKKQDIGFATLREAKQWFYMQLLDQRLLPLMTAFENKKGK
jgi:hypothetical protein